MQVRLNGEGKWKYYIEAPSNAPGTTALRKLGV